MKVKKLRAFFALGIICTFSSLSFQNCGRFDTSNLDGAGDFSSSSSEEVESSYVNQDIHKLSASVYASKNKTTSVSALRGLAASLSNPLAYGILDLGSATFDGLTLKQCAANQVTGLDNRAFLEKAIAAAGGSYATLIFPPGTYCFSSVHIIDSSGLSIVGSGSDSDGTVLRLLKGNKSLFEVGTSKSDASTNSLNFSDFKITMADPKSTVVAFNMTGTAVGLSWKRISAEKIGRFARLFGKMLNVAFEEINIQSAYAPAFFFDGIKREGGKDKWGPQPISFFSVTGNGLKGAGAWIRFAGAASINLHNLDLTGGLYAVHSVKSMDTNPRYITGQDIRLHDQSGPALKFENGLGIQLDNVQIDGCKDYGVYMGGVFDRGAQFSDFQISGCKKYGFRINNVDFINIINPKIQLAKGGKAAVRIEGQVRNGNLYGGQMSGTTVPVERACKSQKCPTFKNTGTGTTIANWKQGMFHYTPTIQAIQARRQMVIAGNYFKVLNNSNASGLQNAIDALCATGGTIVIGRSGITLAERVKIGSQCAPIEIRGTSSESKSKVNIANNDAGITVSGSGHNLRQLNFYGEDGISATRPLELSNADDILLDINTFKRFARGVYVHDSKNLYFNYNRYSDILGNGSVFMSAEKQGDVDQVKMLLETSKCVYNTEKPTTDPCSSATSLMIRGGVDNVTSVQSAYITGGTSIDMAANSTSRPGVLRFFQMGSDNAYASSLKASDVQVLQIDNAWLGQALSAIVIKGGIAADKITLRGVQVQGLENTLNTTQSSATISSLGGWYRIVEPKIGGSTKMVVSLFESKDWVGSESKSALAATKTFDDSADTGEDDSYVMSNEEIYVAAIKEYAAVVGKNPNDDAVRVIEYLLAIGVQPEEIGNVFASAKDNLYTMFGASLGRTPLIAEVEKYSVLLLSPDSMADVASLIQELGVVANPTPTPSATPAATPAPTPAPTATPVAKKSCAFNGQTIVHGGKVTAFANSLVGFGKSCQSETRVCNDGNLSGSYGHTFCNVDVAKTCAFNGQTIQHGSRVTAFANSTVNFGGSCQSESRLCNNGDLTGSYGHTFCNVAEPKACNFVSGITVAHGQSVIAYKTVLAVNGKCTSERRLCNNGSLGGSYGHSFCK